MNFNDMPNLPILLVDDEPTVLHSSKLLLKSAGIKSIITLQDSTQLLSLLKTQEFAVIILDLFMPDVSGVELLPIIFEAYP